MSVVLPVAVAAALVTQVAIAATTVYLHRGLAHRAVTFSPLVAVPFRFVIWVTTGMRPREWVAVHRQHHAATDTEADPHSPIVHGFWRVQLGNVGLYRSAARNAEILRKYTRDVAPDRLDRALFDHALLGLGFGTAVLAVAFHLLGLGWWVGLIAAAVHAGLYVMLSGAVNAVGHRIGRRPHDNSATNGQLLALVSGGEGLHNNHHAAPTSARFALAPGEIDPGWWVIRAMRACGLARVRHQGVRLETTA